MNNIKNAILGNFNNSKMTQKHPKGKIKNNKRHLRRLQMKKKMYSKQNIVIIKILPMTFLKFQKLKSNSKL